MLMRFLSLDVDSTPVWINSEEVSSLHEDSIASDRANTRIIGTRVCMKNGNIVYVKCSPDIIAKLLTGETP